MAIFSEHLYINCPYEVEVVERIIDDLSMQGFQPLISRARDAFFGVLGKPIRLETGAASQTWLLGLTSKKRLLAGDLFYPDKGRGVLYLALFNSDGVFEHPRLQIGGVGDPDLTNQFSKFKDAVMRSHMAEGDKEWLSYGVMSSRFSSLSKEEGVKFVPATGLILKDLDASRVLEAPVLRGLALRIKASGGLLQSDLMRKEVESESPAEDPVAKLDAAGLLSREYVVICKRSSNQVNRVDSREKVRQMSAMGVLCSCGAPIAEERVEEFIRPSATLVQLLNGSFWMSARLDHLSLNN